MSRSKEAVQRSRRVFTPEQKATILRRRRAEGLSQGDHGHLPGHARPDVYRTPAVLQPRLRLLEGAQGAGGGAGGLRGGAMRRALPTHRRELAAELGAGRPVLRLLAGRAPHHQHDVCHRESAQSGAQGDSKQGPLPDRRGGGEADLPRAQAGRSEVEAAAGGVAAGEGAVCDSVRRPLSGGRLSIPRRAHKTSDTPGAERLNPDEPSAHDEAGRQIGHLRGQGRPLPLHLEVNDTLLVT